MDVEQDRLRPDRDALYKVAYDEAARALSEQLTLIDSFRNRAGLLLSGSAVTSSFLGAQALGGGVPNAMCWIALAAFAGGAIASLSILWPRYEEFSADSQKVIMSCIEAEAFQSVEELHRDLALSMRESYVENWASLGRLAALFQIASALLVIQTVAWIVAIAMTA
jgi:hypothetical protein